ncbi:hypothetical protein AAFP30_27705 [Gordonia sp. CPCC 205515]|uniref:hypothetical protein n=1 Tax=Gordonia sp. CPCC 205515 TaxID=3140791 RepID=UPI003AF40A26
MIDTPRSTEEHTEDKAVATSAIEPLPELETVTAGDDPTRYGFLDATEDIDAALDLELAFLAALLYAPPAISHAVITALIGTRTEPGNNPTVLPADTTLFLGPATRRIFETAVALIDEGTPATPQLVQARLTDNGAHRQTKGALLDIVAPATPRPSVAGGADLPHLAAALVDAWYRRGYLALVTRMHQITTSRPVDELAGHWAALTTHQQTAERRRLAVRDTLARI